MIQTSAASVRKKKERKKETHILIHLIIIVNNGAYNDGMCGNYTNYSLIPSLYVTDISMY